MSHIPDQNQILRLIGEGKNVQAVAVELGLGVGTVLAKIRAARQPVVRAIEKEEDSGGDEPRFFAEEVSQPGRWRIEDMDQNQCRFPTSDDSCARHLFCGEPKMKGSPHLWCEKHHKIVYTKRDRR